MATKRSFGRLLHWATHRIPGVPAHAERLAGHQARAHHGRAPRRGGAAHPSPNHSAARPPRVMAAWQRRIAAFFGREV